MGDDSLREPRLRRQRRGAPSTRVDKANANVMPKLRASAMNMGAIRAEAGARGYHLIGLDIGVDESVAQLTNLVELGSGRDTRVEAEPSDIVVDRCYLHGNDKGDSPARRRAEWRADGDRRLLSRELPRRAQRLAGDRRVERRGARSRS